MLHLSVLKVDEGVILSLLLMATGGEILTTLFHLCSPLASLQKKNPLYCQRSSFAVSLTCFAPSFTPPPSAYPCLPTDHTSSGVKATIRSVFLPFRVHCPTPPAPWPAPHPTHHAASPLRPSLFPPSSFPHSSPTPSSLPLLGHFLPLLSVTPHELFTCASQ